MTTFFANLFLEPSMESVRQVFASKLAVAMVSQLFTLEWGPSPNTAP